MTFEMKEEAQTITVYNFKADTKEFIGAGDAYIPAHTGLPANCTDVEPIIAPTGKVTVFDCLDLKWLLVDDHRGETVFDVFTQNKIHISELGPLPENVTSIAPSGQYQRWNGKAWEKDEDAERLAMEAEATEHKKSLMQAANERIATLQDAVELEMATDDEMSNLIEWKKYRVKLSRVDPAVGNWPSLP